MPTPFTRLNDNTTAAPRLRIQHSLWSLTKLPMNAAPDAEWSLDEKCERVKAAGFEGIECFLRGGNADAEASDAQIAQTIQKHGLRLTMGHRPFSADEIKRTVERAKAYGADFVFAQPGDAFMALDDVVTMVTEGRKAANDAGLCLFVETHRNNYTENLPQTLALIERVPDIRFTADLSHFVVVGEFYGWEDERAIDRMMPVLTRTSHMHARIGNGEQVQVDVGDGTGQTPQFFVKLWTEAMRHWRKNAAPGDIFPFASELGPPRYAITLPDGREFSDRWEQSLVMKRLAEQAWAASGEE